MQKKVLVKKGLEILKKLHRGNIATPLMAFVSRWKSDPLARGSYAYLPPGKQSKKSLLSCRPSNASCFAEMKKSLKKRRGPSAFRRHGERL